MSDKFAKLFDTKYGQILVFRQGAEVDDGEESMGDEVRVFIQPEGLGVCSVATKFKDTESGYESCDKFFDSIDENNVLNLVKPILDILEGEAE